MERVQIDIHVSIMQSEYMRGNLYVLEGMLKVVFS